jgi:phosphopantothenoylcysteine decarboxylase/phosphopantothenate--cysteine ligase
MFVMTAAVADYRPAQVADEKVKKKDGDMSIPLTRTKDILGTIGQIRRDDQVICGFSMETENMLANSQAKLERKNADLIVANNVKDAGAGFGVDTNLVTVITREGAEELPLLTKDQVAHALLDRMVTMVK